MTTSKNFNTKVEEGHVVQQMAAAYTPDQAREALEASGVMVPSVRDKDGTGYDIFSLLLKERIVMFNTQVESAMASVIVSQLKFLESLDADSGIEIVINSPGGSIVDGLGIYDTTRNIKCPISTTAVGMAASMGSIALVSGDKGSRGMAPHAQLLVHQGSGGGGQGTPSDLEIGRAFHMQMVDRLTTIYQDQTGLTKEYWGIVLEHDTWFTAEQALEIGFIDYIQETPQAKVAPYAADRATSPVDALEKEKAEAIAEYDTVDKIVRALNTTGATSEGQKLGRLRPELAVKLAQFPEFWTEGKKKEMEAKKAQTASANDNAAKKPQATGQKLG